MCAPKAKPVLFSGVRASGNLTIGNYLGAIRNWVALQETHDCFFCLVDLHTITVRQDPAELLRRSYEFIALYLACGIEPERSTVFVQSHVPAHAQLAWVLNCFTYVGELRRMAQFKEKARRHAKDVNAGLLDYPVLMAADILLYGTHLVPVGEDQKQHVELTRDIAQRFNGLHGEVFVLPEPYLAPVGARIMSLQNPTAKMDKSDENASNYIGLLDEPEAIRRKIRRAVTDSGAVVAHDETRPGIANLVTIYAAVTGDPFAVIEERYRGTGYGRFKDDLADVIVEFLRPVQERYREIRGDEGRLEAILRRGAQQARERARPMLRRVHDAVGFIAYPGEGRPDGAG